MTFLVLRRSSLLPHRRAFTFGVPALRRADDCAPLAAAALARCEALVGQVLAGASTPSPLALSALDSISAELCGVLDTMELARNVHPNREFAVSADGAYQQLASKMAELNTDERMYHSVRAVLADGRVSGALSDEQLRFARCMSGEFEHDGAHLPVEGRERLRELQASASGLAQEFSAGAANREARGGVWVKTSSLRPLPNGLLASFARRGESVCVPADRGVLSVALEACDCGPTRRKLYECRESLGAASLRTLHRLLGARHAVAGALDRASYAELALSHDRMETQPRRVVAALGALCNDAAPHAGVRAPLVKSIHAGGRERFSQWSQFVQLSALRTGALGRSLLRKRGGVAITL